VTNEWERACKSRVFRGFHYTCLFLSVCIVRSSAVSIVPSFSFSALQPCRLWMRRFGWVEVAASDGDECVHCCTHVVEGWRGPGGATDSSAGALCGGINSMCHRGCCVLVYGKCQVCGELQAAVVVCSRTQSGGIVCACRDGKENKQSRLRRLVLRADTCQLHCSNVPLQTAKCLRCFINETSVSGAFTCVSQSNAGGADGLPCALHCSGIRYRRASGAMIVHCETAVARTRLTSRLPAEL
jgi:hypothetical protein